MKKLFSMLAFFMMAMCVLTLSSCGDDDDENKLPSVESINNRLMGTWEVIGVKAKNDGNPYSYNQVYKTEGNLRIKFLSNGVLSVTGSSVYIVEMGNGLRDLRLDIGGFDGYNGWSVSIESSDSFFLTLRTIQNHSVTEKALFTDDGNLWIDDGGGAYDGYILRKIN